MAQDSGPIIVNTYIVVSGSVTCHTCLRLSCVLFYSLLAPFCPSWGVSTHTHTQANWLQTGSGCNQSLRSPEHDSVQLSLFQSVFSCFFCVYVLLLTPRNYEAKVTATLVCTCRIPKHSIMIYDRVAYCQSQTEPPNSSSQNFFQSKLAVTRQSPPSYPPRCAACTGKVGNMILKQTLRAANDPVSTFWKWHGLEAIFSSVLVVPFSLLFSLMLWTCLEKDKLRLVLA